MRVKELQKVTNDKVGRIIKNNVKTEPNEDKTLVYLTQFGFNIELIRPNNTAKANNPDIMMLGTIWEIKGPTSNNKTTLKNRFSKASKQARKIIFDLRGIKHNSEVAEKEILKLFEKPGNVDHMIIIRKNGTTLDFSK